MLEYSRSMMVSRVLTVSYSVMSVSDTEDEPARALSDVYVDIVTVTAFTWLRSGLKVKASKKHYEA